MDFDALLEALRNLAEENWRQGLTQRGTLDLMSPDADMEAPSGPLQAWTLQPDQIATLVRDIILMREQAMKVGALLNDVPGSNIVEKTKKLKEYYLQLQIDYQNLLKTHKGKR